jgi:superfamily I DNA and RNA helicase
MHEQDKEQEQIGLHIPPGPQQIRGIAGSGKTTIMAKKAAAMHAKNPDWKIAFTFNTRALYQTITKTVADFYRDFTNGMEPDENLEILHAWGQKPQNVPDNEQAEGLYRKIALAAGIEPYRMRHSLPGFGSLNTHAADLVTGNEEIPQIYDAIFIDEAQDFLPGFYRMCYEALREPKRLIWAYDEAQSLNSMSAPSPKEIFDKDDKKDRSVDLSGMYKGGVRKSFVMRQSYRTPRDILMAAHALGMGLYCPDRVINPLTRKRDWDSIGYHVEDGCSFSDVGSEIRVSRRRDLSPHPLQSHVDPGELLSYSFHDSVETEAKSIAQDVLDDIQHEELDPNEIMVVCVGPKDYAQKGIETARNIRAKNLVSVINECAVDRLGNDNIARVATEGSRDEFWKHGKVTVAGTDRAKGNEAASVHVAGAEQIFFDNWENAYRNSSLAWREDYVQVRNEILVALTRSEGWCKVNGIESADNSFLDEIRTVYNVTCEENPTFVFDAPDPQDITGKITIDESVPTYGVREGTE